MKSDASQDDASSFVSGCIPNDLGSWNATCCSDGVTGCAVGYHCASSNSTAGDSNMYCVAGADANLDPLVQSLPRYRLCQGNPATLTRIHGLPVSNDDANDAKLAYYSSYGDITDFTTEHASAIEMALIVVHGANRNADDYFCTATAAVAQQHVYNKTNVLTIAPWFAVAKDHVPPLVEGGQAMLWSDEMSSNGAWRYGAGAVFPESVNGWSSFEAMDALVQVLLNDSLFPNLQRITVAGHSSGGQFVQRWSLTTSVWNNPQYFGADKRRQAVRMRGVVANPSSYAYLTPLRYRNLEWKLPEADCPDYNQWEWGLDAGTGNFFVPYVQHAIQQHGIATLVQRYAARELLYLAGSRDACNVSSTSTNTAAWCNSHGLETTCRDECQGPNRWERHLRYMASLKLVFDGNTTSNHTSIIIPGVGHDHSLIFNSPDGLEALFGMPPPPPPSSSSSAEHYHLEVDELLIA